MIEIKRLRQLIDLMKQNDLTELDLRDQDEQVTLKRGHGDVVQYAPLPAPTTGAPQAAGVSAETEGQAAANEGLLEITSPMVGTFYAATTPDAEPFARVGTAVDADAVVCLIEAMKVFNEIKAEMSGAIEKVLVGSGEAVEFGQPLFLVRPK